MFSPFVKRGLGLHTGCDCEALVEMGLLGSGVVFIIDDVEIPARPDNLFLSQERATALALGGKCVRTAEHLMAALAAFGETDVRIFVDGGEIPILDGSALPWAAALLQAGAEPKPQFVGVCRQVFVEMGESKALISPITKNQKPAISATIDFNRPELGRQAISFCPVEDDFVKDIAPARTFALESEVEAILGAGLARGGSLDCALVIGAGGPLNPGGLRFADEPVRHKLLDAMGDLFLLGGLPWADVRLHKPGHRLMHELASKAFDSLLP